MRVLIAGGGTGGHIIPALALARELRDKRGAEVRFVGTARGLETRLVPEAGFQLSLVRTGQWKNVSLATRIRTALDLPLGVLSCLRLIHEFRPYVVVGVGGYASGPGMLAAVLKRVPILAYEPNAVPGMTNRRLGKWVSAAAVNFEESAKYFRNATVTGIPVRAEFFAIPELGPGPRNPSLRYIPDSDAISPSVKLLVTGGSQGARVFNAVMPKIARQLIDLVPGLTILHQAGAGAAAGTADAYRAGGANPARWEVCEFLADMPQRFAESDLILCRSGATTVAELCAAGRPSVLVPFPGAADDHQLRNAEVMEKARAARLRLQETDELMTSFLSSDLTELLADREKRVAMGREARKLARPNALERIVEMVVKLAGR